MSDSSLSLATPFFALSTYVCRVFFFDSIDGGEKSFMATEAPTGAPPLAPHDGFMYTSVCRARGGVKKPCPYSTCDRTSPYIHLRRRLGLIKLRRIRHKENTSKCFPLFEKFGVGTVGSKGGQKFAAHRYDCLLWGQKNPFPPPLSLCR